MFLKACLIISIAAFVSAKTLPLKNGHVYHTITLSDFGKLNVTFAFKKKNGLKTDDKQRILDMHNVLRAKIASGLELNGWNGDNANPGPKKMPTAANMQAMQWDDRIAAFSQDWANKCIDGHSNLNVKSIPGYSKFSLGENLSGDITFLERDMYGEVRWWDFDSFDCQKNKKCGHYLNFVGAGMSRVGCGWNVCFYNGVRTTTMVCVYAGVQNTAKEAGKERSPLQHEYLKGPPCSACEQGWDFCMGGGLCATKKQCDSNPTNECKCINKKDKCERNGGTFDEKLCKCTCPADRMGTNCAKPCKNSFPIHCGMDCGDTAIEAFFCEKTCGSCGRSESSGYDYWFKKHKIVDTKGLKVRAEFCDPDEKARKLDVRTLADFGKCKNKGKDPVCNILMYRGYCKDTLFGSSVRSYCALSCSACAEAKARKEKELKEAAAFGFGDVGKGDFNLDDKKELTDAQIGDFKDVDGLGDLDLKGFKIVR